MTLPGLRRSSESLARLKLVAFYLPSAETGFLKNQIQQLNNEKFKNNQHVAVLAERVRSSELEIGMRQYMG